MTPDELLKSSEIDVIVNLTIPATHYQVNAIKPVITGTGTGEKRG